MSTKFRALVSAAFALTFTALATRAQTAGDANTGAGSFLTVTLTDIGRPYDVIDGACFYGEGTGAGGGFSFGGDPIVKAINKTFEEAAKKGREIGADALVGYDIDFQNRTEKDESRVLLCGTFVKFR